MKHNWFEISKELGFFIAVGCICAVALGKDINWDLYNYHFYNPWAWWNSRNTLDIFPAQVQTFFNPLIDFPFYWAVLNLPDNLVVLMMGIPFGVGLWFIWRCLGLLVGQSATGMPVRFASGHRVIALVFACTGAAGWAQVATTTGEWVVAALVLGALWALFAHYRQQLSVTTALAVAGMSLGLATGLKLTAAVPTAAITAALFFLIPFPNRGTLFKGMIIYVGCGMLAFALVAGPWMWFLYKHYQSPLFPFFNSVFDSPLIDVTDNFVDSRFSLKRWQDLITAPIELALVKGNARSELNVRDPRLLIGLVIGISWMFSLGCQWLRERCMPPACLKAFLAIVFLLNYVGWIALFGIYRYTIVLEVMATCMLFMTLHEQLGRGYRLVLPLVALAYGTTFALTSVPSWGRTDITGGQYFDVRLPELPADAMVINMTDEPVAYLVPLWPGHPRFAYPVSNFAGPKKLNALQQQIMVRLHNHQGPIFTLQSDGSPIAGVLDVLSQLQLAPDPSKCTPIPRRVGGNLRVCATVFSPVPNNVGLDTAPRF